MSFLIFILLFITANCLVCNAFSNWENMINASIVFKENNLKVYQKYIESVYKSTNISEKCETSILDTLRALQNLEDWSYQMYNSWGKFPPSGVIEGTVTDFGDYDQCLAIKPNQVIGESQYCLIDISLPLPKPMPIHQNIFHKVNVLPQFVNKSSNNVFVELSKDASFFYWIYMRLGICAPNLCKSDDLKELAENSEYTLL